MRVLLTGMGGDFGAKTAALIEADPAVEAVLGLDAYPPRRRLHQSEFRRIDPRDRVRTVGRRPGVRPDRRGPPRRLGARRPGRAVRRPPPHHGRHPRRARAPPCRPGSWSTSWSARASRSTAGARARPGARTRTPRSDPRRPTAARCSSVEQEAAAAGRMAEVPVALLRFAPTVGVQYPSPLSRLLRLPVVPVNALVADPDGARRRSPCSTWRTPPPPSWPRCGAGSTARSTSSRRARSPRCAAARIGGRVPLPIVAPGWIGDPPAQPGDRRARSRPTSTSCCCGAARPTGARPRRSSASRPSGRPRQSSAALYDWAPVVYLRPGQAEVA